MLESDRHEARDREPDTHHLACHVLRLSAQEDRHAHQPIATDALDEGLEEGFGTLLVNGMLGQLRRRPQIHVAVCHQQGEDDSTDEVADPTDRQELRDVAPMRLFLKDGGRHGGADAREEHTAGKNNDEQVHREQCGEHIGLNRGVVLGYISEAAGDHQGEHASEADVDAGIDSLVEDLEERLAAELRALVREGLVGLLGALAQGHDFRHGCASSSHPFGHSGNGRGGGEGWEP
mmetsp:Transcript_82443/g.265881  ORF Transcript_82443/g.265881 Transcript_82443/m.265881 type:complete len:234 (-) Transcript_82443:7-708(-)